MEKRIESIDYIRVIATVGIILFHFSINGQNIISLPESSNFSLGEICVSVFFIMSGQCLALSNNNKLDLKKFYIKRFKKIFPMYYIAWFFTYLFIVYYFKGMDENIPLYRIYLTIIGMDGYLLHKFSNFYVLGEWFLGCIVLIYLFFPLLLKCLKKNQIITSIVIFAAYVILYINYDFEMIRDRNFIINLPLFVFGMILAFNNEKIVKIKKQYKLLIIIACGLAIGINLVGNKINLPHNLLFIGVTAYTVLYLIFENIKPIGIIKVISYGSYAIFLTHHVINNFLAIHFKDTVLNKVELILVFAIYVILITFFSGLLIKINDYILNNLKKLIS